LKTHLVSPIHDAAAKGNVGRLKELIEEEHWDVNATDAARNTPLHWAAGAGHLEAVQYLLSRPDIKLNEQNLLGDTPLHRAVWRNQRETVKALLEAGIDMFVVNRQGFKAKDLARDDEIQLMLATHSHITYDDLGEMDYETDSEEAKGAGEESEDTDDNAEDENIFADAD
jgi:ankyrin repeat protein